MYYYIIVKEDAHGTGLDVISRHRTAQSADRRCLHLQRKGVVCWVERRQEPI